MLILLAKLASAEKDKTCLEKIAEETIKASPPNSMSINQHVYLMWLLAESNELEKMETLLEQLSTRVKSDTESCI